MDATNHRLPHVVVAGPAAPAMGGIASVIDTSFASGLGEHHRLERFATSGRRDVARGPAGRAIASLLARGLGFDGAFNLEAAAQLRAFHAVLRARPDLVHLHCSHGWDFWLSVRMARAARRAGVRSLLHLHGNFDVVFPRWPALRRAAFPHALLVPDRLIVLSEGWKTWFASHVDPARIDVVRNAIDVGRFRPRTHDPARSAVRLLFVGLRDAEIKGAYDLLAVAPEIVRAAPEVHFVLAGEDDARLEERFVRGTPLAAHCTFLGRLDAGALTRHYEEADVMLIPSRRDASPLALVEAMAAGLPVVASRVGAIAEVLGEPGGGEWIDAGDRPALARAVLALVRDPARRAALGAANRARAVAELDRTLFGERLAAVYARVLERPS